MRPAHGLCCLVCTVVKVGVLVLQIPTISNLFRDGASAQLCITVVQSIIAFHPISHPVHCVPSNQSSSQSSSQRPSQKDKQPTAGPATGTAQGSRGTAGTAGRGYSVSGKLLPPMAFSCETSHTNRSYQSCSWCILARHRICQ